MQTKALKILLIQRDHIGDLIVSTPLITTLAKRHQVDLLVNSYNQSVLDRNPHVNAVHIYKKVHQYPVYQRPWVGLNQLKMMIKIWFLRYDVAIIVNKKWNQYSLLWAKISGAKRIIAIGEDAPKCVTDKLSSEGKKHIVEWLHTLAYPLGIQESPGELKLFVSRQETEQCARTYHINQSVPIYGLQISARKEKQRWPIERFIELAHKLYQQEKCEILLFWSPGSANTRLHPGDDAKALKFIENCANIGIKPIYTAHIRELAIGMSLCDQILTSDGGALHVAVALKKPVVALFGNSSASLWGPWKVPRRVIEAAEQDVRNITASHAYEMFAELRREVLGHPFSKNQ